MTRFKVGDKIWYRSLFRFNPGTIVKVFRNGSRYSYEIETFEESSGDKDIIPISGEDVYKLVDKQENENGIM